MILITDFDNDNYDDYNHQNEFKPRFINKKKKLPPIVQLCKEMMPDIKTIGESIKAFDDDIKFLSDAISNEFDHDIYFNNALLKTFNSVIIEQPQKQFAIAILTLHIFNKNSIAGKKIIKFFLNSLQELINNSISNDIINNTPIESNNTGNWNKLKLILRFLSLLSPIILLDDLLLIFKKFIDLSINLNNLNLNKRIPLSELIFNNTLLNLPFIFYLNKIDRNIPESFKKIIDLINFTENNFKIKNFNIDLLNEFNNFSNINLPYERKNFINLILPNIKNFFNNNDINSSYDNLFIDYSYLIDNIITTSENKISLINLLSEENNNDNTIIDIITLPNIDDFKPFINLDNDNLIGSVDKLWKTERFNFNVYLPNSIGLNINTMVPIDSFEGQLFNDIIIDLVESMEFNRNEVARQVITLDLFFKQNFFTKPSESINQLIENYQNDSTISTFKIEDLAIETILSLLFKLPDLSQPFAYFYTLLVEICKNSPKAIAPVFGRAFRFFYQNLKSLDFELRLRFLDWFSIQMSNFNFSWKWNEWENDSIKFSKSFYNPKINFARNLIQKELRLTSNSLDIEDSLPIEFKKYLDTSYFSNDFLLNYYKSIFNNNLINFNDFLIKKNELIFLDDKIFTFNDDIRKILDYFHKQNNQRKIEEIEEILINFEKNYSNLIIIDFNQFLIILLIQCLVYSGSRSLSHANKYINDLKDDLKLIFDKIQIDQELKEQIIIDSIIKFWNLNSQTGFLICDAFKHAGLITSKSIIKFIFTEFDYKNYALSNETATNAIFRNLSQRIKIDNDNDEDMDNEEDLTDFEFVFEQLILIINSTVKELNHSLDEEIVLPEELLENDDIEAELPLLDTIWKYQTALSLVKSFLRKYSKEYKKLSGKFIDDVNTAVEHQPTKERIIQWLSEVTEL